MTKFFIDRVFSESCVEIKYINTLNDDCKSNLHGEIKTRTKQRTKMSGTRLLADVEKMWF